MGQSVTLGTIHLDLEQPIPWGLSTGARPFQTVIQTDAAEAADLLNPDMMGKPLDLTFNDDGGENRTFKGVYILAEAPASLPHFRGVLISDFRWLLSRPLVVGFYNKPRRTGRSHLKTEGEFVPIELGERVSEYLYAPWSLLNGEQFTPRQVLEDVIAKLKGSVVFDSVIPDDLPEEFKVFDLDISDNGDLAIERALTQLPGVTCYALDHTLIFINTIDGQELGVISNAGPQDYGRGSVPERKFDFSAVRPSAYRIYFIREHELRIDNREEGGSVVEGDESLYMENVTYVTDPSLPLSGDRGEVGNGTVITFEDAIAAYNEDTGNFPDGAPSLSHTVIQEAFFSSGLLQLYVSLMGGETPDPIWSGRTGGILRNYRTLYRINPRVMARFHKIRPVRAAMIDPVRGSRGKALAYSDHCLRFNARVKNPHLDQQLLFGNVTGYNALLANAQVAPAIVSVEDEEVGVIRVDYLADFMGQYSAVYPSKMVNIPTANLSDVDQPTALNEEMEGEVSPKLASDHRIAIVLTVIPASPNSKRQLYSVTVTPDQVANIIGDVGVANGPVQERFVRPGVVTARFGWDDGDGDSIRRAVGIIDPPENLGPDARAALDETDVAALDKLLTNKEDIEAFARAAAAVEWGRLKDRPLGSFSVRFNPDLRIRGAVKTILHTLATNGEMTTQVTISEELKMLDPMGLLPDKIRQEIRREPMQ